jgi:hypothetical protein
MARIAAGILSWVALLALAPLSVAADKEVPNKTEDGLELKTRTKHRVVYVRPQASFAQYKRYGLADCYVEFSKTWLKDYNSATREPGKRINDDDLQRAKASLAAQFREVFTEELSQGGYELSETTGHDVLLLRPALVNIAVNAPDLMTAGRSSVYAESAGQMTLYLELWDSETRTILGRVMDAQADANTFGQRMTSVDNRAAAAQILREWAVELRKKLDVAQGKSTER